MCYEKSSPFGEAHVKTFCEEYHCTEVDGNAVNNVDNCTIDEDTATIKECILATSLSHVDCVPLASPITPQRFRAPSSGTWPCKVGKMTMFKQK